jgi:hypothetical protein
MACKEDGSILPSIEGFQNRSFLPKVYYIFYEYFFKAVISKGTWKQHFTGNKTFGTNILEAYALAIIKNNYFTWLYNYKSKHPGSTLQMEYDLPVPRNTYDNDSDEEENNKEKTNDNNATPTSVETWIW